MRGVLDAEQSAKNGGELAPVRRGGPQKILRTTVVLGAVQVTEPAPANGVRCRYPGENGKARRDVELRIPAALLKHRPGYLQVCPRRT